MSPVPDLFQAEAEGILAAMAGKTVPQAVIELKRLYRASPTKEHFADALIEIFVPLAVLAFYPVARRLVRQGSVNLNEVIVPDLTGKA